MGWNRQTESYNSSKKFNLDNKSSKPFIQGRVIVQLILKLQKYHKNTKLGEKLAGTYKEKFHYEESLFKVDFPFKYGDVHLYDALFIDFYFYK